jgi:hypothetical protein
MKRLVVSVAVVLSVAASFGAGAAARRLPQICNWGGTPAAPTGQVTIDRGLTVTPSAEASAFQATGALTGGGRCKGTMTFDGLILAGSTCQQAWFDGAVKGLRGVTRFAGSGVLGLVHEFLYDKRGNIVGADQPVLQVPQPDGYSHVQDCATPEGFTRAVFSSTVELFG